MGLRALAAGQFQATAALLAELNNVLANLFRNALQVGRVDMRDVCRRGTLLGKKPETEGGVEWG